MQLNTDLMQMDDFQVNLSLICCQCRCISFLLIVCLNSHFSLLFFEYLAAAASSSTASSQLQETCCASAAASEGAQLHRKLKNEKTKKPTRAVGSRCAPRRRHICLPSCSTSGKDTCQSQGEDGEEAGRDSKRKSGSYNIKAEEREGREVRLELKTDDGADREGEAKPLLGG